MSSDALDLYSKGAWFEFRQGHGVLTEDLNDFPLPLQVNARIVIWLDHSCFLPTLLIHRSCTIDSLVTDIAVKETFRNIALVE